MLELIPIFKASCCLFAFIYFIFVFQLFTFYAFLSWAERTGKVDSSLDRIELFSEWGTDGPLESNMGAKYKKQIMQGKINWRNKRNVNIKSGCSPKLPHFNHATIFQMDGH